MLKHSLVALACSGLLACQSQEYRVNPDAAVIYPAVETTPVASADDAADDPAIWVHPSEPQNSLILGTDKQRGLAVYNLQGEQRQFLATGRLNNVDIRQGVLVAGKRSDIAVATNRSTLSLDIFTISDTGNVALAQAANIGLEGIYGLCLYQRGNADLVAFVNSKAGWYQQWLLNPKGEFKPQMEGEFMIASQPEGCVVDDVSHTLYLGEENKGVWKMPADYKQASSRMLIDETKGERLAADVEGLAIYHKGEDSVLVVSSQGDNSYAFYRLADDSYLGSLRIADNTDTGVDGVQETDGLAVSSVNFGGVFSQGLLVTQDGFNTLPKQHQNFKLTAWESVQQGLAQITAD